jgi:prepilin-type N-terminal cleavage/methylation domain-containing protein
MNMKSRHGFTLVELLAVVTIMLILMAAAFGTFNAFAERAGPDAVLSTIQSTVNTARSFAASSGYTTRIYFTTPTATAAGASSQFMNGTTISIRYLATGATDWNTAADVPDMKPMTLMNGMYVLKDIPATNVLYKGVDMSLLTAQSPSGTQIPTAQQITSWRQSYDVPLRANLTTYAIDAQGQIQPAHQSFYIEVDPSGYLTLNPANNSATTTSKDMPVTNGLIVVKLASGSVPEGGYAFYPLNASTGTRLVFE